MIEPKTYEGLPPRRPTELAQKEQTLRKRREKYASIHPKYKFLIELMPWLLFLGAAYYLVTNWPDSMVFDTGRAVAGGLILVLIGWLPAARRLRQWWRLSKQSDEQ